MSLSLSLSERLRPKSIAEVLGQDHLLAPDAGAPAPLRQMSERGKLSSMILWGPPGSGKTTIARLLGETKGYIFRPAAATSNGLAAFRKIFDEAGEAGSSGRVLLFIDEIHRLTRTQQDCFLPVMEDGQIVLIGATTENPSFALCAALLSRARVFVLNRLSAPVLEVLAARAEQAMSRALPLTAEARTALLAMADGDGRFLLSMIEAVFDGVEESSAPLLPPQLAAIVQKRAPVYDQGREEHYNLISALHKSVRGSDVDAALYWLARMLAGGEDPFYILRRMARAASEDIGMADPQALAQVMAAKEAYAFLGSPEGELAIAQAVIYLAAAPKSNASYKAFGAAGKIARQAGSLPPPKNILNAPTGLMKQLGYGKNYVYEHDEAKRFSGQNFFPESIERPDFYRPANTGFEKEIAKRLAWWGELRKKNNV